MRLLIRLVMWLSSGYGKLVPIMVVAVIAGMDALIDKLEPGMAGEMKANWILGALLGLFSAPTWFWGRSLNRRDTLEPHTFILIKMEYWAILVPAVLLAIRFYAQSL